MSTKYICKRCNYKCSIQTDIIKHMKKKNICHKSLEAYSYSEDQLSVLSLLPYVNNINIVNNDEIEYADLNSIYNWIWNEKHKKYYRFLSDYEYNFKLQKYNTDIHINSYI